MNLNVQTRLAASVLKASSKRVWLDSTKLAEIKESITKEDIRTLIVQGSICLKPVRSISKGRQRVIKSQKSKGLRRGHGSLKGKKTARLPKKEAWMNKIRIQRKLLKELRDKEILTTSSYRDLYRKSKGGFFRSKRHIKLYISEHKLAVEK